MTGIKKYVIPPPLLPQPPMRALEVPTMFLSKNAVLQTWHGTKVPPRMPTKNRMVMRPPTLCAVPESAVGRDPSNRVPMKVHLGPKRSQHGPAKNRTIRVAVKAAMLELATSTVVMFRSRLMVTDNSGGNAYQDQKAMKKPNQEKKKTRPYMSMGLNTGIDRALWLIGLTSGARHSTEGENMVAAEGFSG